MKALLVFNDKREEFEIDQTLALLSQLLEYVSLTDDGIEDSDSIQTKCYDHIENYYLDIAKGVFDERINNAWFTAHPENYGYVDVVTFNIIEG